MSDQKTFRKIITEKEFTSIVNYLKDIDVKWRLLEPIAISLSQLPDADDGKNKKP